MLNKLFSLFSDLAGFGKGHERTKRAKKNITYSFALKGLSIALGLVSMPLTINYLDPHKYGIWVTLSGLIAWFGFFDIGLGGGLRNRFAEALAQGKHELARNYVATTYAILSITIAGLFVIFYLINPFLPWNSILNVEHDFFTKNELETLALITFTTFSLTFVLNLISIILIADQRPALASTFNLISQVLVICIILILIKTTQGSLLHLAIAQSFIPVLILMASTIWFFKGRYKKYRPAFKYIQFSLSKDLFNLSIKFFILGIAVVLLFQTNNIIISQIFGPEQVTPYNVAFKYFTVLTMGFNIIITPFWSAFTEAWNKKEIVWIKNIVNKIITIWFVLVIIGIIMLVASKWIFSYWIGNKVEVPYLMSALICLWVLLNAWNSIYSHFLNGVGKLSLQMFIGIGSAILNVPLAIFLGKKIGIEGVFLANVLVTFPAALIFPLQYKKLITENAKGFWNK